MIEKVKIVEKSISRIFKATFLKTEMQVLDRYAYSQYESRPGYSNSNEYVRLRLRNPGCDQLEPPTCTSRLKRKVLYHAKTEDIRGMLLWKEYINANNGNIS